MVQAFQFPVPEFCMHENAGASGDILENKEQENGTWDTGDARN